MYQILFLLVVSLLLVSNAFGSNSSTLQPPIVKIKNGLVKGFSKSIEGYNQTVFIYQGIRYGKPPIGELRFQKPQPVDDWQGVYEAIESRTACYQVDKLVPDNNVPETSKRSEDCLFLTVYRPSLEAAKPRPVMMWIHGGGFETGSIFSVAYDGSNIVLLGDVIVVTIQYRVGSFGFLYGGTNDTQGNTGLYDQIEALKWIKANIAAFGGDPNQVTIFGESSGGISVGALLLSPLANGLFQRAIMQSGAPNSYLGSETKEKSMVKTMSLAQNVNCTGPNMVKIVKCLRERKPQELVDATKHARTNGETFEPIYEDALLPISPVKALKTGQFNRNIDLIFGTVSEEGALFAESIFPNQLDPALEDTLNLTNTQVHFMIDFMFQLFHESYGKEVADFYTQNLNENDRDAQRKAVGDAFGDYHVTCPTVLFGQAYAGFSPANRAYAYRVVQRPAIPVFLDCKRWMGVCHGDDVMFLFGFPIRLRGIEFTEEDYQLSVEMIKLWTHFAHTGVPSDTALPNGAKWTEAIDHNGSVRYMSLNATGYQMVDDFYAKSCEDFWKKKIFS